MTQGRHSEYNPAIVDMLCDQIAKGSNINLLAETGPYPTQPTLYAWLRDNEDFFKKYRLACQTRAHARSDRIDGYVRQMINKEIDPAAANVAIRAESWQAAREAPKIFGDRIEIEQHTTVSHEFNFDALDSEQLSALSDILAAAAEEKKPILINGKTNGKGH